MANRGQRPESRPEPNGVMTVDQGKLRSLKEKLTIARDNVKLERRVFDRLAHTLREDSATLQGVAMDLAACEALLDEILRDMEAI